MASKFGALDRLRSAVGILYTKKGRIALAISCDDMPETMWSVDNPAYLLMSRLSEGPRDRTSHEVRDLNFYLNKLLPNYEFL